jgi:hypothetical protein
MTFAETILTLRGHHTGQSREWEKYRLVAYQVYTSIPKKSPNKSIQEYFPLPTDQGGKKLNPEMVKARRQAFLDKMAKN